MCVCAGQFCVCSCAASPALTGLEVWACVCVGFLRVDLANLISLPMNVLFIFLGLCVGRLRWWRASERKTSGREVAWIYVVFRAGYAAVHRFLAWPRKTGSNCCGHVSWHTHTGHRGGCVLFSLDLLDRLEQRRSCALPVVETPCHGCRTPSTPLQAAFCAWPTVVVSIERTPQQKARKDAITKC